MKKFLVLYHSSMSAKEQMAKMTPEQGKAGMAAWMVWAQHNRDGLVDIGSPLGDATRIKGSAGPDHIGGFSIVQAESVEAATHMFEGHPHFGAPGASIELIEVLSMPGM